MGQHTAQVKVYYTDCIWRPLTISIAIMQMRASSCKHLNYAETKTLFLMASIDSTIVSIY